MVAADCTELYLSKQGTEQLAGFERLVNLEVLWINDNKLVAINNLDSNIRIKQLYAHVSARDLWSTVEPPRISGSTRMDRHSM